MKENKRIIYFLFSFLILVLNSFLFPQEKEFQPKVGVYGGELRMAVASDPKSFNPILAKETSTTAITGLIFEGLTRTNGITLKVEPNLAESWEVDESGLVWTFHLRKDVYWFDGHPFTSKDVVFTFRQLIYNPDIPNSARDIFTIEGKIFKVEAVDKFTVRFTLPLRFAPFLRSMSQEILPQHILQDVVRAGKFNSYWGLDTKPDEIIGTGPFRLKTYLPGEKIVLERNPNYWRRDRKGNRLPYLERVVYFIVQSQDIALLKFQEGEIDFYSLRGEDYPILKPQEKEKNFTIYNTGPAFGTNFLVFNQNRGRNPRTGKPYLDPAKLRWFTNLDFRTAVAHSLDKTSIINIVMNGLGFPQHSSMSPSSGFFYNANVKKYEYNLDKAKIILKKAGFIDRDGDGVVEDREGRPVRFNLFTNAGNTTRIKIANIIRKDLERIGFRVNFVPLAFNNLVEKLTSTFDWDAVIIGLTGGIEPHFGSNVWLSSGQLHIWYPRQRHPSTEWEEEVDRIFNQAVQELDRKKRKALYDRWQEIVAEELPLIYIVLPANILAVRNKFENLYPTSFGGAFHNLEEIFLKQDE